MFYSSFKIKKMYSTFAFQTPKAFFSKLKIFEHFLIFFFFTQNTIQYSMSS